MSIYPFNRPSIYLSVHSTIYSFLWMSTLNKKRKQKVRKDVRTEHDKTIEMVVAERIDGEGDILHTAMASSSHVEAKKKEEKLLCRSFRFSFY